MRKRWSLAAYLTAAVFATGTAQADSCWNEAGNEDAQAYVDQCLEVSPATRPPCNADNSCDLIIQEIVRGCEMLGNDAPEFCGDYSG